MPSGPTRGESHHDRTAAPHFPPARFCRTSATAKPPRRTTSPRPDGDELELAEVDDPVRLPLQLASPTTRRPTSRPPTRPRWSADLEKLGKLMLEPGPVRATRPVPERRRQLHHPGRLHLPRPVHRPRHHGPHRPAQRGRPRDRRAGRSRSTPPRSAPRSPTSGCRRWTSTRSTATAPPSRAARRRPPRTSTTGSSSRSGTVALRARRARTRHPRRPRPAAGRPGARPAPRGRRRPDQGQHRRQPQRREPDRRPAAPGLPAVPQPHGGLGASSMSRYYTDQAVFDAGPAARHLALPVAGRARLPGHGRSARASSTDLVLQRDTSGYDQRDGEVWMPLEFSVAAFRFGHTMVRGAYDYNRNFGRPGRVSAPRVRLALRLHRQGRLRRPDRRAALQLGDRVGAVRRARPAVPRPLLAQGRHPAGRRARQDGQREPGRDRPDGSSRSWSTWRSATCSAATSSRCRPARPSRRQLGLAAADRGGDAGGQLRRAEPAAGRQRVPAEDAAVVLRAQGGRGPGRRQLAG